MSLNLNTPQHIFTSTMIDDKGNPSHHSVSVNIYIILLTALIFFAVLSWFNFALAVYETLTSSDPDHEDSSISALGFAVIWSIITICIYYVMKYSGILNGNNSDDDPLLRDDAIDFAGDTTDYFGSFGFL